MRVTELENKIREYPKPRPQMKFTDDLQAYFADERNYNGQPIEYQNQKMEPINTEVVNKEETVVEKITYDDATVQKAKDLLEAMNSLAQEDELAPYMRLGEVAAAYNKFVPIDFLVNDLKFGTENEINQKFMGDVMNALAGIISQEKTKEIETEEIEDELLF